jgi:hypothetical protein
MGFSFLYFPPFTLSSPSHTSVLLAMAKHAGVPHRVRATSLIYFNRFCFKFEHSNLLTYLHLHSLHSLCPSHNIHPLIHLPSQKENNKASLPRMWHITICCHEDRRMHSSSSPSGIFPSYSH